MSARRAIAIGVVVVLAAGASAAALLAGKAGAETTTSLHGSIALTGGTGRRWERFGSGLPSAPREQEAQPVDPRPFDHVAVGWSPDGSRLLVRERDGLYSMRANGRSKTLLTTQADWGEIHWSPAATASPTSGYLERRHSAVYVVNANGTHERLLTNGVQVNSVVFFDSGDFSWAPKGKRIVFAGHSGDLLTVRTTGTPLIRTLPCAGEFSPASHGPGS